MSQESHSQGDVPHEEGKLRLHEIVELIQSGQPLPEKFAKADVPALASSVEVPVPQKSSPIAGVRKKHQQAISGSHAYELWQNKQDDEEDRRRGQRAA